MAQALPALKDDSMVLILYGDVPLTSPATLQALLDQTNDTTLGLLTVKLPNPTGYGRIIRNAQNAVVAIVEEKDANDQQKTIDEVNTGIMAVPAAKLKEWLPQLSSDNAQGEYYLTDVIAMAVANGLQVSAVIADDPLEAEGINSRAQLAKLERAYQATIAEQLMASGATLADPARIDVRGELTVGKDVFIDINTVFEGKVALADNVVIGPNVTVKDSTVAAGAVINANSVLENATVGEDCDVGPFARLRPGAKLAAKAKVGNYVEVKNAQLGEGSKANHLAYIGDAEVGSGCNIGAGTITCNYDGANKHKTVMGDNVFIGSNSTLVAPITINTDGFVGAGSTISSEVPSENLAVSRAKQRNIAGWKRPTKK